MTMEDFELLHEYEQEEIIYQQGIFLKNYVTGNTICDAYQLASFYVVFSYPLSSQGGATMQVFDTPENLPFLNEIEIPEF